MDYRLAIGAIPALIIVAGLAWSIYRAQKQSRSFVYRSVKRREPAEDGKGGEILELECGHVFRLTHTHRTSFLCEACVEEKKA